MSRKEFFSIVCCILVLAFIVGCGSVRVGGDTASGFGSGRHQPVYERRYDHTESIDIAKGWSSREGSYSHYRERTRTRDRIVERGR